MTRPPTEGYDWLLGAAGKRILLTGLLGRWDGGWTAPQLARLAGVEPKRTAQGHLARLEALQLAVRRNRLWYPCREQPVAVQLSALLEAIDPELIATAEPVVRG
jgi:hypothetical protein